MTTMNAPTIAISTKNFKNKKNEKNNFQGKKVDRSTPPILDINMELVLHSQKSNIRVITPYNIRSNRGELSWSVFIEHKLKHIPKQVHCLRSERNTNLDNTKFT